MIDDVMSVRDPLLLRARTTDQVWRGWEELGGLNVSLGWEWEAGGASDLPTSGHITTAWLLQL